MKFGLDDETLNKINSTFRTFSEINQVMIYGSRAKGNYRRGSDIDLTLQGEKLDLHIVNKIRSKLDDLSLPYTFDFSIYHQITDDDLLEHIRRVGQVFYSK